MPEGLAPARTHVWYRSLYWRIGFGFIALLAVLLLAQAALFLWLTGRFAESPVGRTTQELADFVARELSGELTARPDLDLEVFVREEFKTIRRTFFVMMKDGRRAAHVTQQGKATPAGPPPGPSRGRGRGGRGGPPGTSWSPIVVNGVEVGVVSVPPSPPIFIAVQEFGPTLAIFGGALLVAGAAVAALLIFGPAHRRLRSLETAARALGEGRTDVRASEAGGDEVTALARAFNRMAADLESRAAALAASDAARRQLLADVSHELMTPLTAIRGYVQTLAMPALAVDEASRRKYLEIVDQETYKLEAMIGDLLDLARLEGGGGSLTFESVPVADLFRRVAERHSPALCERRVTLATAIDPHDLTVKADAHRLEQALQNLAANAVRHTPDGGRIELSAERTADGRVTLRVRDTGPGIAPEHLPRVFERFYKAEASRTSAHLAGSGLGLSIVQAIAERHGAAVTAANAPGGGAVFEIRGLATGDSASATDSRQSADAC